MLRLAMDLDFLYFRPPQGLKHLKCKISPQNMYRNFILKYCHKGNEKDSNYSFQYFRKDTNKTFSNEKTNQELLEIRRRYSKEIICPLIETYPPKSH